MDVDELVAQTVGARPVGQSQCWAQRVEGDARQYLTAIEDAPVEDVYQVRVVEILADTFGVEVSDGQVSNHLTRRCKCR